MRRYFFKDVDELIARMKRLDSDMGPIRLQKSLYFLYAFYGATFGKIQGSTDKGELSEIENSYPNELFNAEFEAWQYGPVIRDVYFKNRDLQYENMEDNTNSDYSNRDEREVLKFIDNLLDDLNEMSDFALVDRTHQDNAWGSKFDIENPYDSKAIDNQELIAEYENEMRKASAI
ncbi:Panacea domain-containing protein [Tetragenococcus halophilus]|uniref:Panacea domain-containing protein n=1 Tax=Tetragenococcus halophilus TaxID=51669 RepID=UPI00209ADC8E|nr:type II toxin-antitoxin system antitoxin SocA domain-containing protein [Tetragenococcus halophilus]MCO8292669.1 DUF4065 domain-containing protein [Tetragenococcus halophilus]